MSSYHQTLRQYVREFIAEQGDDRPFTNSDIARWALVTGRVEREAGYAARLLEQKLAREFSESMREAYTTDEQGRVVREMYAARIAGRMRWNSRLRATRSFMETSAVQRREQIVGDCRHLKTDVDSANENLYPDSPIQMSFDFTPDLAELEAGERASREAS
jgi:hypothetical protein